MKPKIESFSSKKDNRNPSGLLPSARLLEAQLPPDERFIKTMARQSLFPSQNWEGIISLVAKKRGGQLPFTFGCFACLPIRCLTKDGLPVYEVGDAETRLEIPKITTRTADLLRLLGKTNFPFLWKIFVADTDVDEIYGDWLANQDQKAQIATFKRRLQTTFEGCGRPTEVILWSEIQENWRESYKEDFKNTANNLSELVDLKDLDDSVRRRLEYFEKKGIKENSQTKRIALTTAIRNVALYAAQGPVLEKEIDCLIIADPNPERLGKRQSLLSPNLPIWYPYPG